MPCERPITLSDEREQSSRPHERNRETPTNAGHKIEYVAVSEVQARGLLHWHMIPLGGVPASLIRIAFLGGINPGSGYWINPAHHQGVTVDTQLDVQQLRTKHSAARYIAKYVSKVDASDREASPQQVDHLYAMREACFRLHGECHCTINLDWSADISDPHYGDLVNSRHSGYIRIEGSVSHGNQTAEHTH